MTEASSWPPALIEDLRMGNVVPFVGAGLSAPSGLPTWGELLAAVVNTASDDYGLPQLRTLFESGRLSSIDAPELQRVLDGTSFFLSDYVISRFNRPAQPNNYHALLGQLRLDTIITTNYDKLIERFFESRSEAVHAIWMDSHVSQYNERNALQIVKMHGHVDDPQSIVLSSRDYASYVASRSLVYALVSVLFSTRTILFLGCSLSDPNVLTLLSDLRRRTGGFARSHYVLIHEPTPADVSNLRSLGLQVIECRGVTRGAAIGSWLEGLVARSHVVATSNSSKSRMINDAIKQSLLSSLPGAVIRMRAAMGIISNPRTIPPGRTVYGNAAQDALELEMGELARAFLTKDDRNKIRTIVHIDPRIQLAKGFSRAALQLRLEAMEGFLVEFGGQIELAQADVPVTTNQVIVGDQVSFLAFKNDGLAIGYKTTRGALNRWTIRSEIDVFDSDFLDVLSRNRAHASELGIDIEAPDWSTTYSKGLVAAALRTIEEKEFVLECGADGSVIQRVDRDVAHELGLRHCSVHLCLFATTGERREVLLQRRAAHMSLYPGMVSLAVTGHPQSPDMRREVLRECSEELGLWLDPSELTGWGTFQRKAGTDREVVALFHAEVAARADSVLKHVSDEIASLYWVELDRVIRQEPLSAVAFDRTASGWQRRNYVIPTSDMVPGTLEEIARASGVAGTTN